MPGPLLGTQLGLPLPRLTSPGNDEVSRVHINVWDVPPHGWMEDAALPQLVGQCAEQSCARDLESGFFFFPSDNK